jgi:hypothetical protein
MRCMSPVMADAAANVRYAGQAKTYPGMHHTAASAPIPAAGNDCCEAPKQMLECWPKSTEDLAEIPKVRKGLIGRMLDVSMQGRYGGAKWTIWARCVCSCER